ncbi:TolB family protein [Methylomonas rhizoryzae]|uniref:TolB family protein n=1 Tax=Methylomonas rhizoryzae TaxID=2608981 RepID=UPI0012318A66|nr:PD40 domain-containing protein [Methylomonas rhizoryzae]
MANQIFIPTNLVSGISMLWLATVLLGPNVHAAPAGMLCASTDAAGRVGNEASFGQTISTTGRWIAYSSVATNLVAGDSGIEDVFVFDRVQKKNRLVSVNQDGESGDSASFEPTMSGNGRWLAFRSFASNLIETDGNQFGDIFLTDRIKGHTTRVSASSDGGDGNGESYAPALSANGRWLAFASAASNLLVGDDNGVDDVFLYDKQRKTLSRVSAGTTGAVNDGNSNFPSISATGRWIAFTSAADNLVGNDGNGHADIFLYDKKAASLALIPGPGANGDSKSASISGNGRYIAFASAASNLVNGDNNGKTDIFVYDVKKASTTRVTQGIAAESNGDSADPSISANGRWIVFASSASNLVAADDNGVDDIFLYDVKTRQTQLLSVGGNGGSYTPTISANGKWAAFASEAGNLIDNDDNGKRDIFLRRR